MLICNSSHRKRQQIYHMIENTIEKKILWGHLDPVGIVYYPKYYEWIDGATHQLFEKMSLNLVELWKTRQLQFGLVKTSCDYFSPGRYHQEILISSRIEKLEEKTVTVRHYIQNKSDRRVMVSGIEKRICIFEDQPDHFRACNIPEDLVEIFKTALFVI